MLLFHKWTTKRPEKEREKGGRERERGKLGRTGQLPDVLSAAG